MKKIKLILILCVLIISMLFSANNQKDCLVGVKTYEKTGPFEKVFEKWKELGINSAFASVKLNRNPEFRKYADSLGIKRFVIIPTFLGIDTLKNDEDLYAITKKGEKASQEWVNFVCPSRDSYRKDKIKYIKKVLKQTDPQGLSIDFIRHFVFWEKVYPNHTLDSIPNTCFCDSCMAQLQQETQIDIPENMDGPHERYTWIKNNCYQKWVNWKCGLITSMVAEIVKEAQKIDPDILINVHTLPWRQDDYSGAIRKVAGQDIGELSQYADYLSPMTYTHMLKRSPKWVTKVVQDYSKESDAKLIPSIQVNKEYLSKALPVKDFKKMLDYALGKNSSGVVLWSWEALQKSPKKVRIIKNKSSIH